MWMSSLCAWPIPRLGCENFRAANLKRSGQATRRFSITRPHSNKRRKASQRWRGFFDFLSRKLLSLPMTYFTSRRTGDIQRRLDGARQVRQFAVQQGVGALLAAVFLVGAVILMGMYSPLLTLAFLATTPLYVGLMIFSVKVLQIGRAHV